MIKSDIQSKLKLSYYKELAILNKEHGIVLVQHIETGKTFVKKTANINSKKIYEQLQKTPVQGIPKTHDICMFEGKLYIIEEQIPGITLQDMLDSRGPLAEEEVRDISVKLCDTLARLHALNPPIIHRDIKPSNVIRTDDNRIILIDFDGAKQADFSTSRDTNLIGTAGFAAPEQYGFDSSKPQTDIYGLGKLMLALLTGDTNISALNNCSYKKVLCKCLQMDPKERYKDALQLKHALLRSHSHLKPLFIVALIVFLCLCGLFIKSKLSIAAPEESPSSQEELADEQTANKKTPVGVYSGDDGELLVLRDNHLAYYYCADSSFAEIECPWTKSDDSVSIELSKLHCIITADVKDDDYSELIFKSGSANWNSEVFERVSTNTEQYYMLVPPCASDFIRVDSNGSLRFSLKTINFTVPKQFRDLGSQFNNSDKLFMLVDVDADSGFIGGALFYFDETGKSELIESDPEGLAKLFASRFMTNVQIGYSDPVSIAGKQAYKVSVSGLLNQGFSELSNQITSGFVYLTANPTGKGVVYVLLTQTIGSRLDDSEAFESIISSATCN